MRSLIFLLLGLCLCGFTSNSRKEISWAKVSLIKNRERGLHFQNSKPGSYADSIARFEKNIYFEINEVYTGNAYIDKNNSNVFYRLLVVPEEENIMLIAEKISFGDEGGNFKLVKLSRVTNDGSVLPMFGLSSATSLKFVDSVNVSGYFNKKKMIINLDKLKPYHPGY